MHEKVAACTPELTGFVAKCSGKGPASTFFWMDSGGRTNLECYGTASALPTVAAGAYEGSGGIQVAGG